MSDDFEFEDDRGFLKTKSDNSELQTGFDFGDLAAMAQRIQSQANQRAILQQQKEITDLLRTQVERQEKITRREKKRARWLASLPKCKLCSSPIESTSKKCRQCQGNIAVWLSESWVMNCELNEASLSIQNRHAELADELLSLLRDIRAKNELLIRLIETDFMPNVKGLQEFLSAVTKDRRQDIEEIIYRASFPELCKSRPAPNHIVTHSIAEKGKRVHEKIVQYEAERSNNIGKIRDIVKQIRSLEITNAPQFNTKIYYVWGLIVPVFFIAGNIEMHLPRNLRWLVYASILGSLPLSWGIIRFAKVLHKRQSDKFKSMISPDLKKLQEEKKALEERNESLKKKSTDLNKKLEKYLDSAQNKCCDFLRKNGAVTFQERWKTAAIRHENQIQFIFDSWKQLTDLRNSFLDLEKCAEYFHVNIDRKIVHNTSKSKVRHDLLSVNTDSIDLKKQSWMSSSLQSMENEVGSFIRLAQNDILICDKCLGHDVLQIDEVLGSGNL